MTKAYREVRKEIAEQRGAEVGDDMLQCRYCNAPTPRSALSRYGARCQTCYEQFLRLGHSGEAAPPEIRQAGWVRGAVEANREYRASRGPGEPNAFAALAQQMHARMAERDRLKGLSDDEVNGLLTEHSGYGAGMPA